MFLSIIIPLYNEEFTVCTLIDKLLESNINEVVDQFEIIIIDDCSTDNSFNVVSEYAKDKSDFIQAHTLPKNLGKGGAIKEGLQYVNGTTIIFQDSDLELDPNDVRSLIIAKKQLEVDFVNGSRYMHGIIRPIYSYKRYLANSFFSWLTSVIIDRRITDMACGYKLIDMSILNQIDLKEKRFGIEAELVLKLMRVKNIRMSEVPVNYFPRDESEGKKLRNTDAFKILWAIFKYGILKSK
jgi:glycosyltransferase involved in cell wall biosynthesis